MRNAQRIAKLGANISFYSCVKFVALTRIMCLTRIRCREFRSTIESPSRELRLAFRFGILKTKE